MSKAKEYRDYMNSLNVDGNYAEYLLGQVSTETDIQNLITKIEMIEAEGVDIDTVIEGLAENPLFPVEEPSVIAKNIETLKQYVYFKDLGLAIESTPEYLTMQEDYLEQNIKMIKLVVSPEIFDILLKAHGEIFTYNTPYLVSRLEFFVKNGLKDKIEQFILEDIELFDLDEEEIDLNDLK